MHPLWTSSAWSWTMWSCIKLKQPMVMKTKTASGAIIFIFATELRLTLNCVLRWASFDTSFELHSPVNLVALFFEKNWCREHLGLKKISWESLVVPLSGYDRYAQNLDSHLHLFCSLISIWRKTCLCISINKSTSSDVLRIREWKEMPSTKVLREIIL